MAVSEVVSEALNQKGRIVLDQQWVETLMEKISFDFGLNTEICDEKSDSRIKKRKVLPIMR